MNALCQNPQGMFLQYSPSNKSFHSLCTPNQLCASKNNLQILLPHLLSEDQPQKRFPASSLHAHYLIKIPLSERGEVVKTDHSTIAFHKFDHRTLFLMEYLHTHNNWENSVQKHKNAYTGYHCLYVRFPVCPNDYSTGFTNCKITHFKPIQHTFILPSSGLKIYSFYCCHSHHHT